MIEPIDDGGPAFPETRWDDKTRQDVQWTGMTLRDYFAAKVLSALALRAIDETVKLGKSQIGSTAEAAYMFADAMIKARQS